MDPKKVKKLERLSLVLICVLVSLLAWLWYSTRPRLQEPVPDPRQTEYADRIGLPLETTNSLGMRMRLIPPGEYLRGSPLDEPGRVSGERLHPVTIPHAFYMSVTPVTQGEHERLTGTNPSYISDRPRVPVDSMTWVEAVEFCNRLSRAEGLPEVYEREGNGWISHIDREGYRLATEAEWEYACRAGTDTAYYTGPNEPRDVAHANLWRAAWYDGNSGGQPRPVGRREANPWGLKDMLGNVWEWCWDWYAAYPVSDEVKVTGPESGVQGRVIRGGSWHDNIHTCRAAMRRQFLPDNRWNRLGFRLVRTAPAAGHLQAGE